MREDAALSHGYLITATHGQRRQDDRGGDGMKIEVRSGNGSRVLDSHARAAADRLLVSDWGPAHVSVGAAKRDAWTTARCAAWRAAHGVRSDRRATPAHRERQYPGVVRAECVRAHRQHHPPLATCLRAGAGHPGKGRDYSATAHLPRV